MLFAGASQVPAQGIFMTTTSGVDNPAVSPENAIPLAGLPSYDDVIAHSDIYASSLLFNILLTHAHFLYSQLHILLLHIDNCTLCFLRGIGVFSAFL